ncbi:phage tail protein [Hymenobacter baengnokdamensis]|uniref:phage tail protein n=1 Tax=Hymenobacter baengnokdamensis TaxID=2615203 RepID=UPI0012474B20|nr:tail fiber protein [Hymenobacter baengnokdamensis]
MDEPYIGEIRPIGINFAPKNWAFCNGQLLSINQNQALFSLLGTTFGGNGTTTFGLPDLRSRVPVGVGQGPGLQNYLQGQAGGTETVTLLTTQLPAHQHSITGTLQASSDQEDQEPTGNFLSVGDAKQYSAGPATVAMASITGTTANAGGNQPHENRSPALGLNYVIALNGVYPSRS